jgi:ankyrin repeat protein
MQGMTPLHHACANGSSLGAIQLLIQAYPEACKLKNHHDRRIPLHMALEKGATHEVIAAIIGGQFGMLRMRNSEGDLPLHVAAMTTASEETVKLLVDNHKEGRKALNKASQRPLDLAMIHRSEEKAILDLLTIKVRKKIVSKGR